MYCGKHQTARHGDRRLSGFSSRVRQGSDGVPAKTLYQGTRGTPDQGQRALSPLLPHGAKAVPPCQHVVYLAASGGLFAGTSARRAGAIDNPAPGHDRSTAGAVQGMPFLGGYFVSHKHPLFPAFTDISHRVVDRGLLESKRTCTGRSPSRNHVLTVVPTAPLGNDLFVMGINTFVLGTRWGNGLSSESQCFFSPQPQAGDRRQYSQLEIRRRRHERVLGCDPHHRPIQ